MELQCIESLSHKVLDYLEPAGHVDRNGEASSGLHIFDAAGRPLDVDKETAAKDAKHFIAGGLQIIGLDTAPLFLPTTLPSGRRVRGMWVPTNAKVLFCETQCNRVLNLARQYIGDILDPNKTVNPRKFSHISVGDGGFENGVVTIDPFIPTVPGPPTQPPGPLGGDVSLYHELFEKVIEVVDRPTDLQVRSTITFDKSEANGELTEFALKFKDVVTDVKYCFSRRTRRPISKGSDMFLVIRWTILV